MVKAKPPPLGCLLITLVDMYGDERVRQTFLRYPELRWRVLHEARVDDRCAEELRRLFPTGLPEPAEDDSPELEEILRELRSAE